MTPIRSISRSSGARTATGTLRNASLTPTNGRAVTRLKYADSTEASDSTNVLAIYVDSDTGASGWWYEGGGIYRHVWLTVSSPIHIAPDGIGTYSNISASSVSSSATDGGADYLLVASTASLHVRVAIDNTASGDEAEGQVKLTLLDARGAQVGQQSVPFGGIKAGASLEVAGVVAPTRPVQLWTIRQPALYTLRAEVMLGGGAAAADAVDTTVGFRSLAFDANAGMSMNGEKVKVRGFCDHNNFASTGMAVPDRVKLFRAQASRSVGGNGRRTSHNAPDPMMLSIYDRVGVTVMGENRKLGQPKGGLQRPLMALRSPLLGCQGSLEASKGP